MSDYFYSSARVRALETALLSHDMLLRLSECTSLESAYKQLTEHGFPLISDREGGRVLRDETLQSRLSDAYREVSELTEDAPTELFGLWRYPYDCNNVKAAIKCFFRGVDCDGMTFDFGTVHLSDVVRAVRERDFSCLPSHMAEAAGEAMESYSKNHNPRQIDLLLDRACYRDMLDAAEASKVNFAVRLIKEKIDLSNLLMCVRVTRMQSGDAGRALLCEAFLEGGELSVSFLLDLYAMEEKQMWERLLYTDYKHLAEALSATSTLTEVERAADNVWMETVREAKFVSCGAEVLIGYLLGVEAEIKNLRIVLAGLATGLDGDKIRERIREGYV